MADSVQFNRIYHNRKANKIELWETINGVRFHDSIPYQYKYYVPDPSGNSEWKDITGNSVKPVIADNKFVLNNLIEEVGFENIHEADMNELIMFLHDRYEKTKLTVDMNNINICNFDIETAAEDEFTKPEEASYPINLITCHFSKSNRLVTWGLYDYTGNSDAVKEYRFFKNEKAMLEDFITIFRKEQVDIITGWNIDAFDTMYIINRCKKFDIDKTLSPVNQYNQNKNGEYEICGIASLDYIKLYRDKYEFSTKESYALGWVGQFEVNEGKLEYEGTISNHWKNNWNEHVEYNIQDVLLVNKIDKKKKYIELSVNIGFQALIPFNKVLSTIAMHHGFILSYLHSQKMVMPCRDKHPEEKDIPGGYVYAKTGRHKYVVSFDVESLYPHLIMQYNIGPETLRLNYMGDMDNIQETVLSEHKVWDTAAGKIDIGGIYYDKSKKSVLHIIVKRIFDERLKFKKMMKLCSVTDPSKLSSSDKLLWDEIQNTNGNADYYDKQQHIRKIQINSLYGALGNPYFNLFNLNNATCITLSGQHFIKYASECFNSTFKKKYGCTEDVVILIDTDSNFLQLDEVIKLKGITFNNDDEACNWIDDFIKEEVNPLIEKFVKAYAKFYDAPNILNFKHEKIIKTYLITGMKHYAMYLISDDGKRYTDEPKFKVMGIETKKTSSSAFIRKAGTEILKKILDGKDKTNVNKFYSTMFKEYKNASISDIAVPGRVAEYDKYAKPISYYLKNGVKITSGTPYRNKAAIYYNYFIKKNNLSLAPITNGTKIKLVYVEPDNKLRTLSIAFIDEWTEDFAKSFKIDYDRQWMTVENLVSGWFDVMNWGKPTKILNSFSNFF